MGLFFAKWTLGQDECLTGQSVLDVIETCLKRKVSPICGRLFLYSQSFVFYIIIHNSSMLTGWLVNFGPFTWRQATCLYGKPGSFQGERPPQSKRASGAVVIFKKRVLKLHSMEIYVCQENYKPNVDVSETGGTPKSSILIGFSIINHPFWGTPIFGNTHVGKYSIHGDIFNWQTFLTDKSTSVMGLVLHFIAVIFSSVSKFPKNPLNLFPFKTSSLRLRRRVCLKSTKFEQTWNPRNQFKTDGLIKNHFLYVKIWFIIQLIANHFNQWMVTHQVPGANNQLSQKIFIRRGAKGIVALRVGIAKLCMCHLGTFGSIQVTWVFSSNPRASISIDIIV